MSSPPGRSSRWRVACRSMVRVDRPDGEATSSAGRGRGARTRGPRWPGQVRDCPPFNAIRLPQQNVKVRSARFDTLFVVFRGGGRRIVLQGVAARDLVTPAPRFHARCAGRSSSAPSAQPFTVRSPCCSGSWPCARTCPSVTLERASGSTSSKPAAWYAAGRWCVVTMQTLFAGGGEILR